MNNKNYEFDTILEDHPIINQNIYRLRYINYSRTKLLDYNNNVVCIDYKSKPFILPTGMSREDSFKVLSYLTDFIEKRNDIEECPLKSIKILDSVLDLERFGFVRTNEMDENKIIDLFTIDGRLLLFKNSNLYPKYFNWYTKKITLKEIEAIYIKNNMTFNDIVFKDYPLKKQLKK